jgi:hypothetical protein
MLPHSPQRWTDEPTPKTQSPAERIKKIALVARRFAPKWNRTTAGWQLSTQPQRSLRAANLRVSPTSKRNEAQISE